MDRVWIIYALVFGAALLGVQAVYWLAFRERVAQRSINRNFASSSPVLNSSAALQTLLRERGFSDSDNRFLRVANDFLTQTGLRFNRNLAFLTGLALAQYTLSY